MQAETGADFYPTGLDQIRKPDLVYAAVATTEFTPGQQLMNKNRSLLEKVWCLLTGKSNSNTRAFDFLLNLSERISRESAFGQIPELDIDTGGKPVRVLCELYAKDRARVRCLSGKDEIGHTYEHSYLIKTTPISDNSLLVQVKYENLFAADPSDY